MDARLLRIALGVGIWALLACASAWAQDVNTGFVHAAPTGSFPSLYINGPDSDIGLLLTPKGAGGVGIGTTAPQSLLQVYGGEVQVDSSGALCTTANGGAIRYASTALSFCNGTTWSMIGGGASGTGTTNYVARWTSSTALGTGTMYDNGTQVGIGTATPGYPLDIYIGGVEAFQFVSATGTPNAGQYLFFRPGGTGNGPGFGAVGSFSMVAGTGGAIAVQTPGGATTARFNVNNSYSNYISFTGAASGSAPVLGSGGGTDANVNLSITPKGTGNVIVTNGNVGIGTTLPASLNGRTVVLDISGGATGTSGIVLRIPPMTTNPAWEMDVTNPVGTESAWNLFNGTSLVLTARNSGNVGIGTTIPQSLFSVSGGNIELSGSGCNNCETPGLLFSVDVPASRYSQILGYRYGASDQMGMEFKYFFGSAISAGFIDAGGRWLLGTSPTAQNATDKLEVIGQSYFSGNVGIGTATPAAKLHAYNAPSINTFDVLGQFEDSIDPLDGATRVFVKNTTGKVYIEQFGSNVGSGLNNAGMVVDDNNTFIGAGVSSNLYLFAGNSYANPNVTVLSGGNVGIGTTSPGSLLQVGSGAGSNYQLMDGAKLRHFYNTEANPRSALGDAVVAGGRDGLAFVNNAASTFASQGVAIDSPAAWALALYTSNGTALTERMRISSGNVGIGTTGPNKLLTISAGTTNVMTGIDDRSINFSRAVDASYVSSIVNDPSAQTLTYNSRNAHIFVSNSITAGQFSDLNAGTGALSINAAFTFASGAANLQLNGNAAIGASYFNNTSVPTNGLIVQGSVGIGTTAPTSLLQTLDSSAKTAAYTGVLHSVLNTSNTASTNKVGMDIESTGTWNGAGAVNTGLVVNATGGTTNYAATFNGGNVGIGTTSPSAALTIITSNTNLFVDNGSTYGGIKADSSNNITLSCNFTNDCALNTTTSSKLVTIGAGGIKFAQSSVGSSSSPVTLMQSSGGNLLISQWWDATNTSSYKFGLSNSLANIDFTSGTEAILFNTNGGERARITSSGNVGIGTTAPSGRLAVDDSVDVNNLVYIKALSNDWTVGTYYATDARALLTNNAYIGFGTTYAAANGDGGLRLGQTGHYSYVIGGANLLLNPVSGNVGIGTTAPQATLDVNGYARLALKSSQPVACSGANQGAIALNHLAQMCACNGTSWIFADSVGGACSW